MRVFVIVKKTSVMSVYSFPFQFIFEMFKLVRKSRKPWRPIKFLLQKITDEAYVSAK